MVWLPSWWTAPSAMAGGTGLRLSGEHLPKGDRARLQEGGCVPSFLSVLLPSNPASPGILMLLPVSTYVPYWHQLAETEPQYLLQMEGDSLEKKKLYCVDIYLTPHCTHYIRTFSYKYPMYTTFIPLPLPLALSLGQWDNFISTSMSHVHMWFYLSTNKETTKEKRHDICLFETNWIWLIWLSPGAYIFLSNVTFVLSFWLKKKITYLLTILWLLGTEVASVA